MGSSLGDLCDLPEEVRREFGYAIGLAQGGLRHHKAKTMKGFDGGGVIEVVENFNSDTYRAVYTIKFATAVYVLHAFQKKSKHKDATPQADIDLINHRLKAAREDHEETVKVAQAAAKAAAKTKSRSKA